jgi:Domain of unknown function (DUF4328)
MTDAKHYSYRDPSRLTRWLRALIWLLIVVLAISVVMMVLQYRLLSDMQAGVFPDHDTMLAAAHANDLRARLVALISVFLVIAAIVVFLFWVYRVSANVHALGATDLNATPGFAVGAYFIPFFNLFMPPVIMSEIWKASIDAPRWTSQRTTPLIAIWWTFQILTSIGGFATLLAVTPHSNIETLKNFTIFMIVTHIVDIVFRITMLPLIGGISRAQQAQELSANEAAKIFS